MKRFFIVYTLTVADIDADNRMSVGAILNYFQDAIGRFLTTARVGPFDLLEEGLTWMIAEFHCDIPGDMPAWPDAVAAEVFLSDISGIRACVDFLFRDMKGRIIARGTSSWLLVDVASRRMISCQELPRFVELYDADNQVRHTRYHFPDTPTETAALPVHEVTAAETDFNGHMSNRDYVRLALSLLRSEMRRGQPLRQLHVKFRQETHAGETLQCRLQPLPAGAAVELARATDGTRVCQLVAQWD